MSHKHAQWLALQLVAGVLSQERPKKCDIVSIGTADSKDQGRTPCSDIQRHRGAISSESIPRVVKRRQARHVML
ncbi:hypothetical protein BJY52DRAFT_961594 [Lactarius psammicola]|nr:hypothetical protein BJY52DRAFT_961594 [Lactarius psammicola]